MENTIRQAILDLSALIEDADSEDAERIREIIERLQNFDTGTRNGDPAILVGVVAPDNLNYQAPAGFRGSPAVSPPTNFAGSPSPARYEG
jgi:hypothetical protein